MAMKKIEIDLDLDRTTTRDLAFIAGWECRTLDQMVTYIVRQYVQNYERDRYERLRQIRIQVQADAANAKSE